MQTQTWSNDRSLLPAKKRQPLFSILTYTHTHKHTHTNTHTQTHTHTNTHTFTLSYTQSSTGGFQSGSTLFVCLCVNKPSQKYLVAAINFKSCIKTTPAAEIWNTRLIVPLHSFIDTQRNGILKQHFHASSLITMI